MYLSLNGLVLVSIAFCRHGAEMYLYLGEDASS